MNTTRPQPRLTRRQIVAGHPDAAHHVELEEIEPIGVGEFRKALDWRCPDRSRGCRPPGPADEGVRALRGREIGGEAGDVGGGKRARMSCSAAATRSWPRP